MRGHVLVREEKAGGGNGGQWGEGEKLCFYNIQIKIGMQLWNILQKYPPKWHLLFIMECFKMANKMEINYLPLTSF